MQAKVKNRLIIRKILVLLLPLAAVPLLFFGSDSIVLFMNTIIMAMAVEATGLHKRIALKLLTKVGAKQPV
ncbi:hypothetical protein CAEBREN_31917 [Caenorhabditis brenneri]|uniref:Uncharacterized protein n=1 Tax=Caenorhabditis brenneri TaxID=135651 RepID=G0NB14_CAEBE|nr:hypothetical protein CAEBREN_31917 [Caenorhabditis brenneri]